MLRKSSTFYTKTFIWLNPSTYRCILNEDFTVTQADSHPCPNDNVFVLMLDQFHTVEAYVGDYKTAASL